MLMDNIVLAVLGVSFGAVTAAGLFAFLIGLGVVSDMADRTRTGRYITLYEDAMILGASGGNLMFIFQLSMNLGEAALAVMGIFAGIFVGCWAMALAEMMKILPMMIRKTGIKEGIPRIILAVALGKGLGAMLFFYKRW